MGCLNANKGFGHWFGNIHLSGPCNRCCYFCIGQHMMALDPLNNLHDWPMKNIDLFIEKCKEHGITEVNLTGSNTDPMLFEYHSELTTLLRRELGPDTVLGLRTNGVIYNPDVWALYDKGSISITTLDPVLYKHTMGCGTPPIENIKKILALGKPVKANVVLTAETVKEDIVDTLNGLADMGFEKINVREPYGQAHVGNPMSLLRPDGEVLGMPMYKLFDAEVVYWDVHYCEVESVNLYANGNISELYPVSQGHHETGEVKSQGNFTTGRHRKQWVK